MLLLFSIVEFSAPDEAQKAIKELSDTPLLGRTVFIREVSRQSIDLCELSCLTLPHWIRTVNQKLAMAHHQILVEEEWLVVALEEALVVLEEDSQVAVDMALQVLDTVHLLQWEHQALSFISAM